MGERASRKIEFTAGDYVPHRVDLPRYEPQLDPEDDLVPVDWSDGTFKMEMVEYEDGPFVAAWALEEDHRLEADPWVLMSLAPAVSAAVPHHAIGDFEATRGGNPETMFHFDVHCHPGASE